MVLRHGLPPNHKLILNAIDIYFLLVLKAEGRRSQHNMIIVDYILNIGSEVTTRLIHDFMEICVFIYYSVIMVPVNLLYVKINGFLIIILFSIFFIYYMRFRQLVTPHILLFNIIKIILNI